VGAVHGELWRDGHRKELLRDVQRLFIAGSNLLLHRTSRQGTSFGPEMVETNSIVQFSYVNRTFSGLSALFIVVVVIIITLLNNNYNN